MNGILNPFVRYAKEQHWGNRGVQKHTGEDCRIFFVLNGEFELTTSERRYFLKEDDTLYLPPHHRYQLGPMAHPESRFVCVTFDLTESQSSYEKPFAPILDGGEYKRSLKPVTFTPFDREIYLCRHKPFRAPLREIVMKFSTQEKYFRDLSSAILKRVLVQFAIKSEEQISYSPPVVEVQKYIQLHYMENITNEDVARAIGYHPYYLSRLLKKETGQTLRRALIEHRLRVSREMLLSTGRSISAIAAECGFTSSSHFTEAFRLAFGQTPKEYRKENSTPPRTNKG